MQRSRSPYDWLPYYVALTATQVPVDDLATAPRPEPPHDLDDAVERGAELELFDAITAACEHETGWRGEAVVTLDVRALDHLVEDHLPRLLAALRSTGAAAATVEDRARAIRSCAMFVLHFGTNDLPQGLGMRSRLRADPYGGSLRGPLREALDDLDRAVQSFPTGSARTAVLAELTESQLLAGPQRMDGAELLSRSLLHWLHEDGQGERWRHLGEALGDHAFADPRTFGSEEEFATSLGDHPDWQRPDCYRTRVQHLLLEGALHDAVATALAAARQPDEPIDVLYLVHDAVPGGTLLSALLQERAAAGAAPAARRSLLTRALSDVVRRTSWTTAEEPLRLLADREQFSNDPDRYDLFDACAQAIGRAGNAEQIIHGLALMEHEAERKACLDHLATRVGAGTDDIDVLRAAMQGLRGVTHRTSESSLGAIVRAVLRCDDGELLGEAVELARAAWQAALDRSRRLVAEHEEPGVPAARLYVDALEALGRHEHQVQHPEAIGGPTGRKDASGARRALPRRGHALDLRRAIAVDRPDLDALLRPVEPGRASERADDVLAQTVAAVLGTPSARGSLGTTATWLAARGEPDPALVLQLADAITIWRRGHHNDFALRNVLAAYGADRRERFTAPGGPHLRAACERLFLRLPTAEALLPRRSNLRSTGADAGPATHAPAIDPWKLELTEARLWVLLTSSGALQPGDLPSLPPPCWPADGRPMATPSSPTDVVDAMTALEAHLVDDVGGSGALVARIVRERSGETPLSLLRRCRAAREEAADGRLPDAATMAFLSSVAAEVMPRASQLSNDGAHAATSGGGARSDTSDGVPATSARRPGPRRRGEGPLRL